MVALFPMMLAAFSTRLLLAGQAEALNVLQVSRDKTSVRGFGIAVVCFFALIRFLPLRNPANDCY